MPITSPHAPKSVMRHRSFQPHATTRESPRIARASRTQHTDQSRQPAAHAPRHRRASAPHPLIGLGLGMLLALIALLFGQVVRTWTTIAWDDWHYGRPRTFQIDAVVGHDDSPTHPSHFMALNLHGRIEIIELPGGDPTHVRSYRGPTLYGPGADLVPVTLQFPDPAHTHHPDMVLLVQGTRLVWRNIGDTFRPG